MFSWRLLKLIEAEWRIYADEKKTSKLRVTGLCEGNSPVTVEFTAQKPVTRKMFPFDNVIMLKLAA